MFIAASKLVLDYYGNQNLKKKREEMTALFLDLKRRFNVSVLEVEDFDDYERCVFGISLVASDERAARAAAEKCIAYIDGIAFARVMMDDTDVFKIGR